MSGLEAIGAAAAILQFVDFASKLLVTGYDVYKSQTGATPQTVHTQKLCTELQSISAQLSQAPRGNITLNDREQSLWRLADRAHDLAWHLGLLLDSLKLKKATFKSWGALRQSWRILHQKDKVAEMVARLDEIKSLMDTNLLVLLRDDTSLLIRLVNDQTRQSKHIRDDGINAVQSLKHELLATMQQHRDSAQLLHEISLRKIGEQLAMLAQSSTALKKSELILENLYCEEVHSREFGVSDAVDCTFDWAFNAWCSGNRLDCGCRCTGNIDRRSENRCSDHLGSLQCPWKGLANHQKHLVRWLENNTSEPFVVTGKPGSGKSTFMKFIASHEQTRLALAGWAGDKKLLVARFYFWSSGSPLQRSQEGLLRCLLYQILSQAPEMIPIAVPRRWQTADDSPRTTEPWARREISEAFSHIINGNPLNVNICFFIDGLDEYGGSDLADGESDLELVSQLKKLASSPHIKLCLSSRPRNVFQKHLISDESRHIILHNHTSKDIEQFVQLRVESVQQLIDIDPSNLKELQNIIAERSSGVFLWVVLAVRDLLDGLEPPFSMPEIKERVLLLPASLDDFFQRILNKMHQQYRRFVARLLLMTLHQHRLHLEIAYCLWFLDKEFERTHLSTLLRQQQPHGFPQSWKSDICLRIGKSCGDLLDTFLHVFHPFVSHTHRSVADFLRLPEIKAQLLRQADWQEPDMALAFCKASVLCCENPITLESPRLWDWINNCMIHAALYESSKGKACTDLIYKLESILCSRRALRDWNSGHWAEEVFGPRKSDWAIPEAYALLFCATIYGLHLFVQQAIESLTPRATATMLNGFLRALVLHRYRCRVDRLFVHKMADAIVFLCSKGADPNDIVRPGASCTADHKTKPPIRTIWELCLDHDLSKRGYENHPRAALLLSSDQTTTVIQGLIEGGADLDCKVPAGCANTQQAIERRLEADFTFDLSPNDRVVLLRGQDVERIKAALSKRGFNWVETSHNT